MTLVLRALNEYDILCDPINNGIASKKMLFDLTRRHLESKEGKFLEGLSSKEREEYIKSYIPKYIKTHRNKLRKRFEYGNREARDTIHNYVERRDNESYFRILQYLSTINNHLANGSRIDTEWISTTTSFYSVYKYCKNQDIHQVAVCRAVTAGFCNLSTFVLDLSDKDKIKEIEFLSKKIDLETVKKFIELTRSDDPDAIGYARTFFHYCLFEKTNPNFRGFNFAAASREICFYNHIDYRHIYTIFERLQIDLLVLGRFNEKSLGLPAAEHRKALLELKQRIKEVILAVNDPYLTHVFEEVYLKNRNIDLISKDENEKGRILNIRNQIISRAVEVPSVLIKK